MKRKHLLTALLVLALTASAFAGCADSPEPQQGGDAAPQVEAEAPPENEELDEFDGEAPTEVEPEDLYDDLAGDDAPGEETPADEDGDSEDDEDDEGAETVSTAGGLSATDAIINGFSTRAFTDQAVSDSDLDLILESGRNAPSARNSQAWHFTVIRNMETAAEILSEETVTEGTVVIVISGLIDPDEGINVDFDCALATQNMYIAAHSLGLGAHIYTGPVSGIDAASLDIPDTHAPVAVICIGYTENPVDAASSATERSSLSSITNYID